MTSKFRKLLSVIIASIMICSSLVMPVIAADEADQIVDASASDNLEVTNETVDEVAPESEADAAEDVGEEEPNEDEEVYLSDYEQGEVKLSALDYSIIAAKPYNFKSRMESADAEVDKTACYTEGTKLDPEISTKYGNPEATNGPGLYGDALVFTFYNGYRDKNDKSDRYGSVCTVNMTTRDVVLYQTGAGSIITANIDEAVYGTNKIGFWAKAVKQDDFDRGLSAPTVSFAFTMMCKNPDTGKANNYENRVTLTNDNSWQYVTINMDPLNDYSGFYAIRVTSDPNGSLFGGNPSEAHKGQIWSSSLYIDEMTFYRGSSQVRTITMPSNDEQERKNFNNSNLKSIYVGESEEFNANRKSIDNIVLTVPEDFDFSADMHKIKIVPEVEDFAGDSTRQMSSGAVGTIVDMPSAEGEQGLIKVVAASGKISEYNFTIKYDGLLIAEPYNGNFDTVTNALRTVKVTNYARDGRDRDVVLCCVVRDKTTNELVAILTASDMVPAYGSKNINFRLRTLGPDTENYIMYIYFIDSFETMNKAAKTIIID